MHKLVQEDSGGEGLAYREFDALVGQLGLDATRFNTIYLGAPMWQPQRDELSDLYETSINGTSVERVDVLEGDVRALDETPDGAGDRPETDATWPRNAPMRERAEELGFKQRGADQLERRCHMGVQTMTRVDGPGALASLATGMGRYAIKTPENLIENCADAMRQIDKAVRIARVGNHDGADFSLAIDLCLKHVSAARDVVCVAWLQTNEETLQRIGSGGRSNADLIGGMEAACAALQSAMLDVHRAKANWDRLGANASADERVWCAEHSERMLRKVARAKLAAAMARIVPQHPGRQHGAGGGPAGGDGRAGGARAAQRAGDPADVPRPADWRGAGRPRARKRLQRGVRAPSTGRPRSTR